ncbi:beta-galactosidase [Alicyclobacillus cellulosilyticus]|uniref:Beta-galactosidase n=1 Tax=Alicyclobacillus cellulosilyticus TaxID=1003997 RepID=A0A917KAE5_9BACL|nr:beta-galactosidase [Alicyclobacillus cellulosilyticus]GGJ03721.1 beta-galactosidase [Alicyclobacillus cellulosilyticus]
MGQKFPPIHPQLPRFLHGADYNPDQWLNRPDILDEDIRLMKLAKCNVMSVGIFSWAALEPEEGVFRFEWLDRVLDRLAENGIYVFLATPSGARPAWMSQKYPEVLRVGANRVRILHGLRHNHCYTSPVYREKVRIINTKLAERYAYHPAVIGWHISNEYGGECHCDLCQAAFRTWLKQKYKTLDALNEAWWTAFWSHTFTDWDQIESPAPHGEHLIHGMNLDWKRFVTDQTVDFCRHEIAPLKAVRPDLPVTTNMMEAYEGLNYWKFADVLDVISWDSYPRWHEAGDDCSGQASWVAMIHDIKRAMKGGRPFMLMESTPSTTNWQPVSKLKRPGMHLLASLQAVAHGADTVQYFQWRKSRGASEKFHGAVVDHCGHEHTRVFQEVKQVGEVLEKLAEVVGTSVQPEVAIVFDWENRWAVKDAQGPRNAGIHYEETVHAHYRAFWSMGIPVDVVDMDADFSKYKLVVAPMLYMVRGDAGRRLEAFVAAGGVLVATYWSGIVDEHDLCFLGGFPGPLRRVLGIWSEEIDALYDHDRNRLVMAPDNALGLAGEYEVRELCDLIHLEGAEALAFYGDDFYAGRPALTVNRFGRGAAYYLAARAREPFYADFYRQLVAQHGIHRVLDAELPPGVTAQLRTDGDQDYVFVMNFRATPQQVVLGTGSFTDVVAGTEVRGTLHLPGFGVCVLRRANDGAFRPPAGASEQSLLHV